MWKAYFVGSTEYNSTVSGISSLYTGPDKPWSASYNPFAAQEFFKDILEQKDYIENRKSILRKRAGLREKDRRAAKLH